MDMMSSIATQQTPVSLKKQFHLSWAPLEVRGTLHSLPEIREYIRASCQNLPQLTDYPHWVRELELATHEVSTTLIRHGPLFSCSPEEMSLRVRLGTITNTMFVQLGHVGEILPSQSLPAHLADDDELSMILLAAQTLITATTDSATLAEEQDGWRCLCLAKHMPLSQKE